MVISPASGAIFSTFSRTDQNSRFLDSMPFLAGHNTVSTGHCLLVAERPSYMLVYLKDGSAETCVRSATLR